MDITRFATGNLKGQTIISEVEETAEEEGVEIDGNVRFQALWMCRAKNEVVWVPVARIEVTGKKNGETANRQTTVYGQEVQTDLCCPRR